MYMYTYIYMCIYMAQGSGFGCGVQMRNAPHVSSFNPDVHTSHHEQSQLAHTSTKVLCGA